MGSFQVFMKSYKNWPCSRPSSKSKILKSRKFSDYDKKNWIMIQSTHLEINILLNNYWVKEINNNSYHLFIAYFVQTTELAVLYVFFHLILIVIKQLGILLCKKRLLIYPRFEDNWTQVWI